MGELETCVYLTLSPPAAERLNRYANFLRLGHHA